MDSNTNHSSAPSKSVLMGISFVAGAGIVLMIVALGVGAIQGTESDTGTFHLAIALGLLALIGGIIAWVGYVQPQKHFDDINVAQYHGHHHDPIPADTSAIVPHDDTPIAVETHSATH